MRDVVAEGISRRAEPVVRSCTSGHWPTTKRTFCVRPRPKRQKPDAPVRRPF